MYLVDTSVWIDFLRGKRTAKTRLLEGLLEEGDAFLCEITFAEICWGARDERQFKLYQNRFRALPFLRLPENWEIEAARMGHRLRKAGTMPFLADTLLALTAIHHDVPLLTEDGDFEPFARLFTLKMA